MNDKLGDKELDRRIKAVLAGRDRGRPPSGFGKALRYADQYWELRRRGTSPWRAKKEVARVNSKTPHHISACVKMVDEAPPSNFLKTPIAWTSSWRLKTPKATFRIEFI
jgi:hypothetical protein